MAHTFEDYTTWNDSEVSFPRRLGMLKISVANPESSNFAIVLMVQEAVPENLTSNFTWAISTNEDAVKWSMMNGWFIRGYTLSQPVINAIIANCNADGYADIFGHWSVDRKTSQNLIDKHELDTAGPDPQYSDEVENWAIGPEENIEVIEDPEQVVASKSFFFWVRYEPLKRTFFMRDTGEGWTTDSLIADVCFKRGFNVRQYTGRHESLQGQTERGRQLVKYWAQERQKWRPDWFGEGYSWNEMHAIDPDSDDPRLRVPRQWMVAVSGNLMRKLKDELKQDRKALQELEQSQVFSEEDQQEKDLNVAVMKRQIEGLEQFKAPNNAVAARDFVV